MIDIRSRRLQETVLIIVIAVVALALLLFGKPIGTADTGSYVAAWQTLSSGGIDCFRTPPYPLLIGLAKAVGGDAHWMLVIMIIQNTAGGIACWLFYRIAQRVLQWQAAAFVCALFFACFPGYLLYRNALVTESLALSGLIFLIYNTVNIYDGKNNRNFLGFAFWLLFLVFLRPSFVYLLPVLAVAFALMMVKKHGVGKRALAAFSIILVAGIGMLGYMSAYKRTYGVFTSTNVGMINDANMMIFTGDLDPSKTRDPKFASLISSIYNDYGRAPSVRKYKGSWNVTLEKYIRSLHDLRDVEQTVRSSKTFANQVKGVRTRLHYCILEPYLDSPGRSKVFTFINFAFLCGYLTILLYGLLLIVGMVRQKRLPWLSLLILMLGGSNIIIVVIGAQSEWQRLVYPSRFLYLLMIAQMLLMTNKKRRTLT